MKPSTKNKLKPNKSDYALVYYTDNDDKKLTHIEIVRKDKFDFKEYVFLMNRHIDPVNKRGNELEMWVPKKELTKFSKLYK